MFEDLSIGKSGVENNEDEYIMMRYKDGEKMIQRHKNTKTQGYEYECLSINRYI